MTRRASALILVFLVAGCGFLKRPPNQFYSLDTVAPAAQLATIGGVPLGIDGVELPPGFDRRGIVVRGADHKFEVRGTHQWASSLEEMVIHTLAFDLAARLPDGMVVLPGQAKPPAMRSLYVTFEDLAPGPDGVFVLDARWTITGTGIPEMVGRERITVNTAMESPAIAAAMSEALGMLADRVVGRMAG